MFVNAIEKVGEFTRPIHIVTRLYGDTFIEPGAATLFFVNDEGYAVTCKHVATLISQCDFVNNRHKEFSDKKKTLSPNGKYNKKLKELESEYQLSSNIITQIKSAFINCVDKMTGFRIYMHPTEDLALIHFEGFEKVTYTNHAVFIKNSKEIKQGKSLCRLGYPFPEFSNYKYNSEKDEIEWTNDGRKNTPTFPIDGIITRKILNKEDVPIGIEMSTPGLKGQSGGPLFDKEGIIYGMQSMTHHLHLGFDIKDKEINDSGKKKKISNYPFLHLGVSVHLDVIKDFLKDKNIKYYESQ